MCRYRSGRGYSRSSYSSPYSGGYSYRTSYSGGSPGGGGVSRRTRSGRPVAYTPGEWRVVQPYAEKAAEQAQQHPDRRDLFLCHAWADRESSARELHGHLKTNGATVWFSEDDIALGSLQMREIDKGLRNSRIGIVLVTPALLTGIQNGGGIAEKELAALLSRGRVVPVLHGVTFEELSDVSLMLASHAGISTKDSSLDAVAAKIAAAAAALPVV
ncbi:toll/interleukin-1 receptor domain-containing protein [uncultured Pseudokineococcus sp.]|uniref:toll/interleukin-1 receptor domain-containing protein n=1 Tax=uncultured Pseudokineococcus sp. TaxID=1642928 RepID=UPI0026220261|nr:toll/interleukin-1 receptor domain-containing protein [uncultured Pseudokineococcus sp.]